MVAAEAKVVAAEVKGVAAEVKGVAAEAKVAAAEVKGVVEVADAVGYVISFYACLLVLLNSQFSPTRSCPSLWNNRLLTRCVVGVRRQLGSQQPPARMVSGIRRRLVSAFRLDSCRRRRLLSSGGLESSVRLAGSDRLGTWCAVLSTR